MINATLAHSLMMLGATAAVVVSAPEARGRPVRHWRLLATAPLVALTTFAMVAYPRITDLWHPELWMFGLIALLVGVARGHWMALQVDHFHNLVRAPRAPDGLVATIVLWLLGAGHVTSARFGPEGEEYQPIVEISMAIVAGFVVGRAGAAWTRLSQAPQVDLQEPANP